jgi:hypothetical protein
MPLFKRKVSAEQLGARLAATVGEFAFEGENSVVGIFRRWDQELTTLGQQLEGLLFAAFPFDVIITNELGNDAGAVRESMRAALLIGLNRTLTEHGHAPISDEAFRDLLYARFREYGSRLLEASSTSFSFTACRNIGRSDDVDAAVALSLMALYSAIMKHISKAIRAYRIVE